jgi:Flp pilus assembly protein TadG
VTAETALALPVVVLVLGAVVATGRVATEQVRCTDAARAAARSAARGESAASVLAEAARLAPSGSRVTVANEGDRVTVTVAADVAVVFAPGAAVTVRGLASSRRETP